MNRIGSETLVSRASSLWRWAGALSAAMAMGLGAAPAIAADANTLDLKITQSPAPAVYSLPATFTVTLTNLSNKTVNNAGITITAPSASVVSYCVLSTGLPCATSGAATLVASGYQIPSKGSLTITASYNMPAPLGTFVLNATGTSSNNAGGPNPSAYTTVSTTYTTAFAPPPPAYPTIDLVIEHDSGNTVLWSTAPCGAQVTPDCGASYYGQYKVTVVNLSPDAIPASKPFEVALSSVAGAFAGSFGCSAPCSAGSSSSKFNITGLAGNGSTSFTVFFKTPQSGDLDVAANATIGPLLTPAQPPYVLDTASVTTPITSDAAIQTYSSLVPPIGGSAKAKNLLDPGNNKGPFSTRVDVPTWTTVDGQPINIVIDVTPGTIACSSSSPKCLDTKLDVQSNGNALTFDPLTGTNFLVITMVRDWTTLDKKPSSVFNATVWYTDDFGNRTNVKDCGSVNLAIADRCIYQRIDMTTSAKGVLTGGYLKFIVWARHNGVMSW